MFDLSRKALIAAFIATLFSCAENKTVEDYLVAANASIVEDNIGKATVELKNAAKQYPENAEVRVALGNLYSKAGLYLSAEKELDKAVYLGASADTVTPAILRTYLALYKYEELLDYIEQNPNYPNESLIYMYQAIAYSRLNDRENAELAVARAKDFSLESAYTYMGQASIVVSDIDLTENIALVDSAIELDPTLIEAYVLKGQLHFQKEEFTLASQAFDNYINKAPYNNQVKLFLAQSLIKEGKLAESEQILNKLAKSFSDNGYVYQLLAVISFEKEDYENAIKNADQALQKGLKSEANRIVLGLSAYKLGRYELANQQLLPVSKRLPQNHPVNIVLALVQVELGYNLESKEGENALLSQEEFDILAVTSIELFSQGLTSKADTIIERLEESSVKDANSLTKLGVLKLSNNDLEGIVDLEKAAEVDPEDEQANTKLAKVYMLTKQYGKAEAIAKHWKEQHPKNVAGYLLSAQIYMALSETEWAQKELNKILSLDEDNKFALLNMAKIELRNKKPKQAAKYLDKVLSKSPEDITALTLSLRAKSALGESSDAISRIETVSSKNEDIRYELLHAIALYNTKQFKLAYSVLKKVDQSKAAQFSVYWTTFIDAAVNLDELDDAEKIVNEWVKLDESNKVAQIQKLELLEEQKDFNNALLQAQKLATTYPEDYDFNAYEIYYNLRLKQYETASEKLKQQPEEYRNTILLQGFTGEIELKGGNTEVAIPKLEDLYRAQPTPRHLLLLVEALDKGKSEKAAFKLLQSHYDNHSKALNIKNLLAEYAIKHDTPLAQQLYREILVSAPNNVVILNNLAWVELQLDNLDSADLLSSKVVSLYPNSPALLETRMQVLFALGKKSDALVLLKETIANNPSSVEFKALLSKYE